MSEIAGVIGAGSFGVTISKLLSENIDVLLYSRKKAVVDDINIRHRHLDVELHPRVSATDNIKELAERCHIIFPVLPSDSFREAMREIGPHLKPSHILIHATKGLDTRDISYDTIGKARFTRKDVFSMSEVIMQESIVVRVGCLSGPNLAKEILAGQPAATVIASEFQEVIKKGQEVLSSKKFFVFGSYDMKGAELAGAYKNIIAIGSGILGGLNMGKNIQALLITRGLREMIHFGMALGATSRAFLGTAGIGDLVATATSENSRNYTFGKRMAEGEKLQEILSTSEEVVEGVRTLNIIHQLAKNENIHAPITSMLYKIVYENYDILKAIDFLMSYPYAPDVDFM